MLVSAPDLNGLLSRRGDLSVPSLLSSIPPVDKDKDKDTSFTMVRRRTTGRMAKVKTLLLSWIPLHQSSVEFR